MTSSFSILRFFVLLFALKGPSIFTINNPNLGFPLAGVDANAPTRVHMASSTIVLTEPGNEYNYEMTCFSPQVQEICVYETGLTRLKSARGAVTRVEQVWRIEKCEGFHGIKNTIFSVTSIRCINLYRSYLTISGQLGLMFNRAMKWTCQQVQPGGPIRNETKDGAQRGVINGAFNGAIAMKWPKGQEVENFVGDLKEVIERVGHFVFQWLASGIKLVAYLWR